MLTNQTNHLIEFSDGRIEVLPMPTSGHQVILLLLYDLFRAVVAGTAGRFSSRRSGSGFAPGNTASRIS